VVHTQGKATQAKPKHQDTMVNNSRYEDKIAIDLSIGEYDSEDDDFQERMEEFRRERRHIKRSNAATRRSLRVIKCAVISNIVYIVSVSIDFDRFSHFPKRFVYLGYFIWWLVVLIWACVLRYMVTNYWKTVMPSTWGYMALKYVLVVCILSFVVRGEPHLAITYGLILAILESAIPYTHFLK
jgi:hypothetical protein